MECVCRHEMTRHDWKNQWVCHRCGRTKPIEQTQTNADRIRAMSDEELAEFLSTPCECFVSPEEDGYIECGNDLCKKRLLEWLKQPAEEGE